MPQQVQSLDPATPLLTPGQVSTLLGIPVATLAIWRSGGRYSLRYIKVGKHVRYEAQEVSRFIAENQRGNIKQESAR